MKIFDIDGPIYKLMTSLTNLLVISICFWLSCATVVGAGAGAVAAFYVCLKLVDNEEGYIGKQFFQSFKSNLKQGFALELITILCFEVVYMDFRMFELSEKSPIILPIMGIIGIFIFTFSLLYAYPQVARYENKLLYIIKNSFRISIRYFGRSVLVVFAVAVEICAFLWNGTMLFIGFLIGPGCIFYTISSVAKKIFIKIEKNNAAGVYVSPEEAAEKYADYHKEDETEEE